MAEMIKTTKPILKFTSNHKFVITMKTKSSLVLLSLIIWVIAGCSRQIYQCKTEQTATEPNNLFYPIDSMNYNQDSKILYACTNDKQNFYIHLRISEERMIHKVFRGGLNIWVDTTGKQKENFGLRYPLMQAKDMLQDQGFPPQKGILQESFDSGSLTRNEMLIFGLDYPGSESYTYTGNKTGITAEIKMDQAKNVYYKATVPLRYLGKLNRLSIGVSTSQTHQIQRRPGGNSPDMDIDVSGNGQMMEGGMPNRQMGGGMPGGQNRGSHKMEMDSPMGMSSDASFWIKNVMLTQNP